MKSPKRILIALLVVILLGAGAYYAWQRVKKAEAAETPGADADNGPAPANSADSTFSTDMPIPVEGAQAIKGDLILEVRASGQAASVQSAVIKAQVAGPIWSIPVRENMPVRAGALLLQLDTVETALNLRDAVAGLDRANATFREKTLGDERITDPQIKAERERAARISSGVEQAEVALEKARLNHARTRVTAPFEGRVASIKVVPGQHVTVGEELMTVVDLDPIKVEVQVLESEVGYLSAGGGARIVFAAFPGEVFEGRIATINPMVDQTTRNAKVTVTLPNPQGRILPGFFANIVLDARHIPNKILVPRAAILERDRRTMLFVFDGTGTEGTAEWRYVMTGLGNSQLVEILLEPDPSTGAKPVNAGEIVLVGGHSLLTHGARIRLTENAAAAEGSRPR
jgi:RND family efflux transporter MFP subunit